MKLEQTIDLMCSASYKHRFIAEYFQTKIRYEKLKDFCNKIEVSGMTSDDGVSYSPMPKHDCPYEMLREQQRIMGQYLHILELRAIMEEIDLKGLPCVGGINDGESTDSWQTNNS